MKKFLGFMGIIFILIIIIGAVSGTDTVKNNNNANKTVSNTYIEKKEKFTLISSTMTTDSIGSCYIEGIIKNNTDKNYSYVQVTFNLYDKSGNQLGTALANINNLQANSTWKYKALGLTSEKVARYEFAEITGF